MSEYNLNLKYHTGQNEVFFLSTARRRTVSKGRRWGFTQGAAQYVIEQMLSGVSPVMWGDTIVSNINKYVERYFIPILKQLPAQAWSWQKQEKILRIGQSLCDFRSADNPENWEGFGYRLIILNEAGIILRNQYLWHNAVRPMLMDYPDSVVIIGGTPKGKNLFAELSCIQGEDWQHFSFTSYDNPFLVASEIDEMRRELPESVVQQEIFAVFGDETEQALIPYSLIEECANRQHKQDSISAQIIWGLDIARHGSDFSVLCRRQWKNIQEIKEYSIPDTMQLASAISYEYHQSVIKPSIIFVETTGIGWGTYDRLRELGLPVRAADVGMKSIMPKVLNKRAEMYIRLKTAMQEGLCLMKNKKLFRQLANVFIEFDTKANLKLVAKEKIKAEIGESPDYSDALALTYFDVTALGIKPAVRKMPWEEKKIKEWSPYEYA